ncbi:receptor-like cytosolic serine/threonine-protein kinase RBK1 isoform X1 [Daucus carota subsp. sativus]|uniref:non-specific serine/threonine protein kinase n=2 Tax=Daucus carota subsp. sativus TaxID=79200 RepID=A0A165XS38_DAUCS|nr:PREDICTED: receptor-like cytosolic serine/threonine-protein kinase RBK1 [Daucus carota subsp. sativus]
MDPEEVQNQENPETLVENDEKQGEMMINEDSDEKQGEMMTNEDSDEKQGEMMINEDNNEKQGEMMINEDSHVEDPSPGVLETPNSGPECDNTLVDKLPDNDETFETALSSPLQSPSSGNVNNNIPINIHGVVQLKSMFDNIKKKSVKRLTSTSIANYYEQSRKSIRWKLGRSQASEDSLEWMIPKPSWRNFTLQELEAATKKFSPAKLLGKGGHAEVYKGLLPDGQIVAVKRITKKEKKDEDRAKEFLSELGIIAHINHPNAAKLIGFGTENGLYLVLQYAPNGSLGSLLHGNSKKTLDWNRRFKVALGIADGLKYLHSDCQRRIIHRDITASNILLSEDYEPEISDFGLAKWLPENWLHHVVSPIEGTFGYMAPEYFMHGIVHEKTDVFAFGVILLELITGRRAVDSRRQSLVKWAMPFLENNNVQGLVDPRLGDDYDIIEMERAVSAASLCVQQSTDTRPNMSTVCHLLRGESNEVDMEHQNSSRGKSVMVDALSTEDYNSTAYLKDLDRHKELMME